MHAGPAKRMCFSINPTFEEKIFLLPSRKEPVSINHVARGYGVELFGVSVTTLEEVFLRVGRDHTEADVAADERLQQAGDGWHNREISMGDG